MTSDEEWRTVVGFPDYEVSDYGRVRSYKALGPPYRSRTPRLRKLNVKKGHVRVSLRIDGVEKKPFVHRLVLEAFVGPCPEGMECRHLDGNGLNNHVRNLAWGTPAENVADRVTHGTSLGERNGNAKLTDDDVREIREARAAGITLHALAAEYGVSKQCIGKAARGTHWAGVAA